MTAVSRDVKRFNCADLNVVGATHFIGKYRSKYGSCIELFIECKGYFRVKSFAQALRHFLFIQPDLLRSISAIQSLQGQNHGDLVSTLVVLGQDVHKVFGTHAVLALVHFTFAVCQIRCDLVSFKQFFDIGIIKGANRLAHPRGFFHHQRRTQQNLEARLNKVQTFFHRSVWRHTKGLLVVPDHGTFGELIFGSTPTTGIQIGFADEPATGFRFVQRLNGHQVLVARDKLLVLEQLERIKATGSQCRGFLHSHFVRGFQRNNGISRSLDVIHPFFTHHVNRSCGHGLFVIGTGCF